MLAALKEAHHLLAPWNYDSDILLKLSMAPKGWLSSLLKTWSLHEMMPRASALSCLWKRHVPSHQVAGAGSARRLHTT
eukprot:366562-Chlamydomonas_euryale.AAC.18